MIGVVLADRLGAIELFGQHPAHQEMRPGQRAECDPVVGARSDGGVEPLRPADDEARRAPGILPAREQGREAFAVGLLAAEVERQYWARWNEDNKEAIAAYNERVEREGLWSDRYRTFMRPESAEDGQDAA